MRFIAAIFLSTMALVTAPIHAAPTNPDCAIQGLTAVDRDLAQSGKVADGMNAGEKAAVAKFDKLLAGCAKANGWSSIEKSRIEQLHLWNFVAETQHAQLRKFGIWPDNVKASVDSMSQLVLGERSWVLKKDQLFLAIEPGLSSRGVDTALLKASAPAKQAVIDIALSYASARQERLKLGLETKLPGLPAPLPTPAVIAKAPPPPATRILPEPAVSPPVATAKPAPTPASEPVKLVEIDYSPLLAGKIYPADPWNCALHAMPFADTRDWEASYNTPRRDQILKARDAAVASCATQHGWDAALQEEVRQYTQQWLIVGDLERFLLEEDIIYSSRSEDVRKLSDADLASAKTLDHSPALQKVIDRSISLYSVSFDDRTPTTKEIESIWRSHKLWAQIELFHRKHGVKQK